MASEAYVVGGGGGGTSSDDLTATKNLVASGYTYVGSDTNDDPGTGTAPIVVAKTYSPSTSDQVIAAGSYLQGAQTIAKTTGTANEAQVLNGYTFNSANGIGLRGTIPSKTAQTYSPSTSDQVIAAGSYLQGAQTIAKTTGTANEAQVLNGYTFNSANGIGLRGTIPTYSSPTTYTPSTSQQTVSCANKYMSANIIINGDPALIPANIKKGAKIFGVTGTWEGYVPVGVLDIYNHGIFAPGWDASDYNTSNNFSKNSDRISVDNFTIDRITLAGMHIYIGTQFSITNSMNKINVSGTLYELSGADIRVPVATPGYSNAQAWFSMYIIDPRTNAELNYFYGTPLNITGSKGSYVVAANQNLSESKKLFFGSYSGSGAVKYTFTGDISKNRKTFSSGIRIFVGISLWNYGGLSNSGKLSFDVDHVWIS